MATHVTAEDLRVAGSRALRFVGADHGSEISFFFVSNDPGQGPELHRHPYTETWLVLDGEATIQDGEITMIARAGDTAVVQAGAWHRFTNTGTGVLRIICVHASPVITQEWRDERHSPALVGLAPVADQTDPSETLGGLLPPTK